MATGIRLLAGEARKGETKKAIIACNDYLRMGPARSLQSLAHRYREGPQDTAATQSLNTLQKWSQRYGWQERVALYEARIEEKKNARRKKIMEEGLALDYERTNKLKRLAELLLDEVVVELGPDAYRLVQDNVWLPDVKQIGGGEFAERVDIVRFNSSLIEQLRGVLDDIAKETGGRRQQVDHLVKNIDFSKLTDEQLQRIAGGEDPLQVILSGYTSGG